MVHYVQGTILRKELAQHPAKRCNVEWKKKTFYELKIKSLSKIGNRMFLGKKIVCTEQSQISQMSHHLVSNKYAANSWVPIYNQTESVECVSTGRICSLLSMKYPLISGALLYAQKALSVVLFPGE